MTPNRFCGYELRTTDVAGAREFYTRVFGDRLWDAGLVVAPLPERAAAHGAPAHWLGQIGVDEAQVMAARAVAHGAQRLGPVVESVSGSGRVVLRDPFGAIVSVGPASSAPVPDDEPAAYWMLHARDHRKAFEWYRELFGWNDVAGNVADDPSTQPFAWRGSLTCCGRITSAALLPGVHPHWLFYFRVPNLEASLATIRKAGGTPLEPQRAPDGHLLAACDDPQGGAFGLFQ